MTITRLFLIRHGQTEQNKTGVLMGSTDTPLNEHGRKQAEYLRDRLDGLEVDTLFSSPLGRALETASIVFGEDASIITDSSIQEYHFGEWEGLHFSEIEQRYPDTWKMWLTDWEKTEIPGSEAFAAFCYRVTNFVDELVAANPGRQLALVSHGGCIRTMLAHYFSESVSAGYWKFKVDNATLTEIEFMGNLPILIRFNYR
jgi:alpha-ribazole phosphatase